MPFPRFVAVGDSASQRFVTTMFAPGLGEGFQFDVGRFAAQFGKMTLDGLHFGQLQVELPLTTEPHQTRVIETAERNREQLELVIAAMLELIEGEGACDGLLDSIVGQDSLGYRGGLLLAGSIDPVFPQGSHRRD